MTQRNPTPLRRLRHAAAGLTLALGAGAAAAQPSALDAVLPPPAQVQQVLTALPALRARQAEVAGAAAQAQRLSVGPHEWSAGAGWQVRRERDVGRYHEQELSLQRPVRWFGKGAADERLGERLVQVSTLAQADAWHTLARSLLADWFELLREAGTAAVLTEQAELSARQAAAVQRRQQAGDAARLDLLAAQADDARAQAAAAKARSRAATLAQALQRRYPGLPAPTAAGTAQPTPPADSPAQWVARILQDNHELELADARAELARQRAERAGLERQADPTLGVRYLRERDGREHTLGVFATLPLGRSGRTADHAVALAAAEQAEHEARQQRLQVEAEAWRIAGLDEAAFLDWQRLDAARSSAQQSAALMARAYQLGEAPLAELLQARRVALDASLAAEQARLEALQARARLWVDAHRLWAAPQH